MNKDNTIDKELDEILLNFRIATDSAMIGEDASAYTEAKTALLTLIKELEIETVIGELEQVVNCWEHPLLAPYWITDRIKQLEATLKDNYEK